jgi:hypothetical protein
MQQRNGCSGMTSEQQMITTTKTDAASKSQREWASTNRSGGLKCHSGSNDEHNNKETDAARNKCSITATAKADHNYKKLDAGKQTIAAAADDATTRQTQPDQTQ